MTVLTTHVYIFKNKSLASLVMRDELQKDKFHCWKSFFHCCFKKASTNKGNFEDDSSKYDYIVEKLIIKRVPLSVFRTQYDIYNIENKPNILTDTTLFSKDDKIKFQSLSTTLKTSSDSLNSNLQSTLHNPVSSVNSEFSKISQEVPLIQNIREKSSVLERSFNENESEISDVQVQISNKTEAIENEYTSDSPDKIFSPRSFPCYRLENVSSPSFNQTNLKTHSENIKITRHLQQTKQLKHRPQTPDRLRKVTLNTDFVVVPVEVHYESPNLRSIRKHNREIEPTIFNRQQTLEERTLERESSYYKDESPTEESSTKSENYRGNEAAETTLKWKIIIKHQPKTSENKKQDSSLPSIGSASQKCKSTNINKKCT